MRSSPRKVTMAGIEWTEQYGCYKAVLDGWMELHLEDYKGEFSVEVAGRKLLSKPKTLEAAAVMARAWAFAMAGEIVHMLKGAE